MSKFSVKKPLTIFVAVIAVLVLGAVAFTRMTPDLLPNMDFSIRCHHDYISRRNAGTCGNHDHPAAGAGDGNA